MATTPTAPVLPAPAPTPSPALAPPTTLSPVTRRRVTRTAPPARMAYTRHATAGNSDDRIIASALSVFYKIMAWGGGIAILIWILFGGFKWGRATTPVGVVSSPMVVERIIERPAPAPAPQPQPVVQPASPRELTPEERAEQYKEERRRQYGVR